MSEFLQTMIRSAGAPNSGQFHTRDADGSMVSTSWCEVHEAARAAATVLREHQVAPRSAVAILVGHPAEVALAAQATWLCGASVTMLHQPTPRTDLKRYALDTLGVLRMIGAKTVILGEPFSAMAASFHDAASKLGIVVVTVETLVASSEPITVDADIATEDDLAVLQLTSGSTAAPKAVRITHRAIIANMTAMSQRAGLNDDDVMVSWLPLFHDMGMIGFLTLPMTMGRNLVKVTPADFLARPVGWMALISEYRGTVTAAPNFAYAIVARALRRATEMDLSTLRIALNGAEPIDAGVCARFCEAAAPFGFDPGAILCAYGMAESTLAVSFSAVGSGCLVDRVNGPELRENQRAVPAAQEDPDAAEYVRLGRPLDGIEIRVRANDGDRDNREVGALQIRGTAVTDGYVSNEGPIAVLDAEGWLDTGDEGYLADGEVVICGRRKDVIILAGRNIYPTDVERIAERVPGVRAGNSVAVQWRGGIRETFAVGVESREADKREVKVRISREVAAQLVDQLGVRPAYVGVLLPGTLPKTPSGKIQRDQARVVLHGLHTSRGDDRDGTS